jgi:PAS domain S-box-containing protein
MDTAVLLVDPGVAPEAGERLRAAGATVFETTTAGAALARLDRDVDCVVVVHRPPALDGIALTERIRTARPGVGVVLCPTDGDEALAAEAVAADVDRYLPSGDPERLIEAVEEVTDGPTEVDPAPVDVAHEGVLEEIRADPGTVGLATGGGEVIRSRGRAEAPEGVEVRDEVPFELKERAMDEAPVGITISDPDLPDNPLIYVNDSFTRMTGYTAEEVLGTNCRFLQGEGTDPGSVDRIRDALEAEEPVSVELLNYRKDGQRFWNQLEIAPLTDADGEVTNYVGFQMDITQRKRAEMAVERYAEQLDRERAALDRVLDRVNGLVEETAESLVQASTREGLAREVCEVIAGTDPYAGAWIGDLDLGSETVTVTAADGFDADPTDTRVDLDGPDGELLGAAIESGGLRSDGPVSELSSLHRGMADGNCAVAAVPLAYRDTRYGVLVVYAPEDAMDERERSVLESIGRMVATGINAVETKEVLTGDDVVVLEFGVRDADLFFVGVSAELGCSLSHSGSIRRDDGSMLVFITVEGATGEAVAAAARERDDVEDATVVTEGEEAALVEVVTQESVLTELADYGARIQDLSGDGGEGRIRLEVPHESTARSVTTLLTENYDGAELLFYRELERPPTTKGEFLTDLRERLTERQLTALQKAYVSGYYDWPRHTDGDALAESMGITRSTFHQHLRAAQRKLVSELFAGYDQTS